jgi:hypothetical protein
MGYRSSVVPDPARADSQSAQPASLTQRRRHSAAGRARRGSVVLSGGLLLSFLLAIGSVAPVRIAAADVRLYEELDSGPREAHTRRRRRADDAGLSGDAGRGPGGSAIRRPR